MTGRGGRTVRRIAVELALLLEGVVVLAWTAGDASVPTLLSVGAITVFGVAGGLWMHVRAGTLQMAWHCPHLDALNLRAGTRDAPWAELRCADRALGTFDGEGKRYREFFPEARLEILKSASRVLDAHRLQARARGALIDAPVGAAKTRLEEQEARSTHELADLSALLQQLRFRLIASTAPSPSVEDPSPALRALEQRTSALGDAVDELDRPPVMRVGDGGVS